MTAEKNERRTRICGCCVHYLGYSGYCSQAYMRDNKTLRVRRNDPACDMFRESEQP